MKSYFKTIVAVLSFVFEVSTMMPRREGPVDISAGYGPHPDLWKYASNDSRVSVFKPESELCCSGNVFPSSPNSYHRCCGSSQFDTTRQKCCDGVVHDLRPGFDCCGSAYFSVKEAKCCISPLDRKAILKQFPATILGDIDAIHSTLCCGLKLFNSKTHICCSADRATMPLGPPPPSSFPASNAESSGFPPMSASPNYMTIASNTPRFIIYQKEFKNTACCKGRIYDRSKESCGYGEDQPQTYESNSHFVQMNYPQPMTKFMCNTEEYSTKTHICCSHFSSENGTFNVVNTLMEKKWPNTVCCGSEIYNYETQLCCNFSKIHEQNADGSLECCGAGVFDVKKEQCCDGNAVVAVEALNGKDSCCGSEKIPYTSNAQMCCGNKVLEIPEMQPHERGSLQCCWEADGNSEPTLYDFKNETCCKGVKHANKDNFGVCCGSQFYNWDDQICCDGDLFNKSSMNDACCGKQVYDSMSHLCCDFKDGVVVQKKSRYETCCGTIAYDYKKEVCCSSDSHPRGYPMASYMPMELAETAVFPRTTSATSCCGLNVIDLETHQCCGSKPIEVTKEICCHYLDESHSFKAVAVAKITPHARCCGKDAYDPNTERCCNNTVVQGDKALVCCGSMLYDVEKQICCRGKVHTVDEEKKTVDCCAENLYDPASQVCCKGAIKDKGEAAPPTACCYPPEEF
uniref:Galaxin-like repeats domain-containing protein n=1 Tax=Strigamia maritima TaxID=126957 RepID=T1IV87_STRMM